MTAKDVLDTVITKVADGDEPLFLLRGRDPLAVVCVMRWVTEAKDNGVRSAKIQEAEKVALEMLAYHTKKLPD